MSSKLLDDLLADIKTAMKSRENDKLVALRSLHAQIKDATVNQGKETTDGDVATVLAKAIKQRQDSIEQFRAGGREGVSAPIMGNGSCINATTGWFASTDATENIVAYRCVR